MFHLQSFPAFLVLVASAEAIQKAGIGNASSSAGHLIATSVIMQENVLKENFMFHFDQRQVYM